MSRKLEMMRKSEARILMYILNARRDIKNGGAIAFRLNIDYIYVMKILGQMYNKQWIKPHKYSGKTYFSLTILAPIQAAKEKLMQEQMKLK